MNTIWILEKLAKGATAWETCFGPWCASPTKKSSSAASFTRESVGVKFRAVPYRQFTRKYAEAIVNNVQHCLIHDVKMVKEGEPDLCGTYATFCPKCRKEA